MVIDAREAVRSDLPKPEAGARGDGMQSVMTAGTYVGRVGGLAVALGIGAAVFVGNGVASADPTTTAGSTSSASESSTESAPSTAKSKREVRKAATATAAQPSKKNKKRDVSAPTSKTVVSTAKPAPTARTTARQKAMGSTETVSDPTPTEADAPGTVSPAVTTADVMVAKPKQRQVRSAPDHTVAFALSHVVGALLSPFAGNSPTTPAESPLPWIAMAAARKEIGTDGRLTPAVTTSDIAPPTDVRSIQRTPLVTALGLQRVPIIGPVFVTPIVALINRIPIVSDLLHPIFGYPLQRGLPAGSPQPEDVTVFSFDGTPINVHFMPATGLSPTGQAPTILDGPGLGMPGATNVNGAFLDKILQDNLGTVSIATLRAAGYNVVTWTPRGEYFSGGLLQLDSPDYEARDVSSIISWLAQQPEVMLDGANDPTIGMVGVSYGGGVQFVSAATDHRIDAIVPTITWNTLTAALYPAQDFKSGWGSLLSAALLVTLARPNPEIYPAAIRGFLTSRLTQAQQELLAARGPGGTLDLLKQITAPTLLFQGTVDTLFPLSEANLNATALMKAGVPTKVVWFCGGHGLCTNDLPDLRDGVVIEQETLAWLDHYVMGSEVSTGPGFQWVDQRGQYYSSTIYPAPPGLPVVTTSDATKVLPLVPLIGRSGPLLGLLPIGGTKARNAIDLTVPAATATTYVVGAPQLTFTYSGTGYSRFVYAQLVDDQTGKVLGNQVTPIPIILDGQTQTISVPLNMIAATLDPGQTVTLQLAASAADFATLSTLGRLTVSSMTLSLPTANPLAVTATTVNV